MISGVRSLLAALLLAPGPCLAQSWDLDALMREMAAVPASRSRFVETRHLALLSRPLELKGSLTYERPSRLAKHVEAPFDELLTVNGEALSLVNRTKGEQRFLSLREQPALRALVESVRSTLAGDRTQLERHYRLQFSGARDAWRLHLVPRDAQLRDYVESITLAGAAARLQRIEALESSGDRSVMTILHDGK
ncbi:MAG TPA: LolA-related protein [Burkholderiales bacterium]